MNLLDLPFDVLHAIAKSYLSLDASSVKNCSLVCRRFRTIVRPVLQSTAVIRCSLFPKYMPLPDAVRWILPMMSPYLRHLVIFCHFPYRYEEDETSDKDLLSRCDGNIEEQTEIAIIDQLRKLENIDQLTLAADHLSSYRRRSLITNGTKLLNGLRITNIRRLVIYRVLVEVSFNLFDSFPNLEELALIGIGLELTHTRVQNRPLATRSKVRVLSLQLVEHAYMRFIAWASCPTCPLDFAHLKTLNFFVPGEISNVDEFQDTLVPFCADLVTLNIALSNRFLGYDGNRLLPFARFSARAPNLQTLRARLFISEDYWAYNTVDDYTPGFSYWLPTFLGDFQDHVNLNTVDVRCLFADLFPKSNESGMWPSLDRLWKKVDQTLLSTRMTIFSEDKDEKKKQIALGHLHSRLPLTSASGNLKIVGLEGWRWVLDDRHSDI